MKDAPPKSTFWRALLATVLFPPLGLFFVWRASRRLRIKLLGTVGVLLGCFLYAAFLVWLLIRSGALEVEWRGGYLPALTFAKTQPDYSALARSRAAQSRALPGLQFRCWIIRGLIGP